MSNFDKPTDAVSRNDAPSAVFRIYKPLPPLSDFIDMFWHHEASGPLISTKERVLPTGTVEFVIRLAKDSNRVFRAGNPNLYDDFKGAIVTGTQSQYFVLDRSEQDSLIGIHFKPGGAFPFFGVPASTLRDCHVSLSDLWGSSANDLRDELLHSETVALKFQILERYLMRALVKRPIKRHAAVEFALKELALPGLAAGIQELSKNAGLSQRRFIQVFSEQVGLTPKLYSRVIRFQNVLQSLQTNSIVDWTDLALACGYFDQAHFNHEFREFSGLNPTTYMEVRTEHLNHVAL